MTHSRYAFVKANWQSDIVDQALTGFLKLIPADHVDVFDVPSAFELPLMAQELRRVVSIAPLPALHLLSIMGFTGMILWHKAWWMG